MTSSLHRQLVLSVDRLALKLAKRSHALIDSGDDADLGKAAELFQALARWAAERAPPDELAALALPGARHADAARQGRIGTPHSAAARLAGLIAELPTSGEAPARHRDARGSEPTV
jgi:hypothetical protein